MWLASSLFAPLPAAPQFCSNKTLQSLPVLETVSSSRLSRWAMQRRRRPPLPGNLPGNCIQPCYHSFSLSLTFAWSRGEFTCLGTPLQEIAANAQSGRRHASRARIASQWWCSLYGRHRVPPRNLTHHSTDVAIWLDADPFLPLSLLYVWLFCIHDAPRWYPLLYKHLRSIFSSFLNGVRWLLLITRHFCSLAIGPWTFLLVYAR